MAPNVFFDPQTGRWYKMVAIEPPTLSQGRPQNFPAHTTHGHDRGRSSERPHFARSSSHRNERPPISSQYFPSNVHNQAPTPATHFGYVNPAAQINAAHMPSISNTYASQNQSNTPLNHQHQQESTQAQGKMAGAWDRAQRTQSSSNSYRDTHNLPIYPVNDPMPPRPSLPVGNPSSRRQSPQQSSRPALHSRNSISSLNITMGNFSIGARPNNSLHEDLDGISRPISRRQSPHSPYESQQLSRSWSSSLLEININANLPESSESIQNRRSPHTRDKPSSRPPTPHNRRADSTHSRASYRPVRTPTTPFYDEPPGSRSPHNSRRHTPRGGLGTDSDDDEQWGPPESIYDNMIGDIKGPFERLQHNGHCEVFTAHHPHYRTVTLKHPRIDGNKDALRRFHREAKNWMRLKHRHVLPFLGTWVSEGSWYLVSPFIVNGSSRAYLQANPLADRPRFLRETAEALKYLHDLDVIHGDVKADNILISWDLCALLSDFGLTKMLGEKTSTSKKGAGSINWQAPELFHHTEPSQRTKEADVYSFGITMAEVLSGVVPFWDITLGAVVMAIWDGARPHKRPLAAPFESQSYNRLWELAERCWAEDIQQRPTINEVFSRLQMQAAHDAPPSSSSTVSLRWLCEMAMIRSKRRRKGMTAEEIGHGIQKFYPGILAGQKWSKLNEYIDALHRRDYSGNGFPACFDTANAGGIQFWFLPSDAERGKVLDSVR